MENNNKGLEYKNHDLNPLLSKLNNSVSNKRLRRNLKIFFAILKNAPLNVYQLTKIIDSWSYSEIKRVIRDLEYCGLISTRMILTDQNRAEKQIIIPEEILQEVMKSDN